MDLKITPSGQTIVKPTALGPVANTDTKLLIYGLFQKGRVLAQDGIHEATVTQEPVSRGDVTNAPNQVEKTPADFKESTKEKAIQLLSNLKLLTRHRLIN